MKLYGLRLVVIVLAVFLTGCNRIYHWLDKNGAEEKDLIGQASVLEKNPKVEEVQALLKLYGYSVGEPDGILGARTREAIVKFQKDNGLSETRFVDQETWAKLNVFRENGLVVGEELNVKLIQNVLKKAGCSPGKADGHLGSQTMTALRTFQKSHGVKSDGKIGFKTLSKLAAYLPVE